MKSSYIHTALGLLALILPALANVERRWSQPLTAAGIQERSRGIKTHKHPKPDLVNNGTFDQLLDHKDPSKGTFKQRFWFDASHWQGQGSPVFLFNAGEDNADPYIGYLEEGTISGKYAEEFGGAVIVIEREYSSSAPVPFTTVVTCADKGNVCLHSRTGTCAQAKCTVPVGSIASFPCLITKT